MSNTSIHSFTSASPTPAPVSIGNKMSQAALLSIFTLISLVTIPIFSLVASLWYLGKICMKGFMHLEIIGHRQSKKKFDEMSFTEKFLVRKKHKKNRLASIKELRAAAQKLAKWTAYMIPGVAATVMLKNQFKIKKKREFR
ncbi:hypothetical protein CLAVI_000798 [Candidatus Clavichlamydia salmonicola]|uniref:hypothetical protein n=1 Tax=Candidatus Clavichlamydia salmonicola TaxID=469812 RepID=UPI001891A7BF|nr:hypothetical protein [Candidatus Clavichlamydia salmonicola]MBF5051162.1 hypothetical protein [Candidatus Clavichlamydia salmonicola]